MLREQAQPTEAKKLRMDDTSGRDTTGKRDPASLESENEDLRLECARLALDKAVLGDTIAELQQAVGTRTRSRDFRSSLLDQCNDAVIVWDFVLGNIVLWNVGAQKLFGYCFEEVVELGGADAEAGGFLNAEYPDGAVGLRDAVKRDREWVGDTAFTAKDGTRIRTSLRAQLIPGEHGGKQLLMIARDATTRIEAEERLARVNRDLESFAQVAAHDLQAPARTVSGLLGILKTDLQEQLDEDSSRILDMVTSTSSRMHAVVADLLEYAKSGEVEPATRVSLTEVVTTVVEDLSSDVNAREASVEGGDLPEVQAPPRGVARVIQNLIANGIKYCESKPEIKVDASEEGGWVTVTVSDNGIGIAREYQECVFEAFKRLHATSKYAGTGIGLATAKRLVESWGGVLTLESTPGSGSRFGFTVPTAGP